MEKSTDGYIIKKNSAVIFENKKLWYKYSKFFNVDRIGFYRFYFRNDKFFQLQNIDCLFVSFREMFLFIIRADVCFAFFDFSRYIYKDDFWLEGLLFSVTVYVMRVTASSLFRKGDVPFVSRESKAPPTHA